MATLGEAHLLMVYIKKDSSEHTNTKEVPGFEDVVLLYHFDSELRMSRGSTFNP